MKKVILSIDGMTCSACSNGLEKYLNKQSGILNASVNLVMANTSIEYDEKVLTLLQIEEFIKQAGFKSLGEFKQIKLDKKSKKDKWLFAIFTILAILLMYVSMGHMVGLPTIWFLDPHTYTLNYMFFLLLLTICFMVYGFDILKNGYKNLIHKTPNMDTLVAIGVITSVVYSLYNMYLVFLGDTHLVMDLYFESAAIVIYFIKLGRYIDGISKDKTKDAIAKLVEITPNTAIIKVDGIEKQVTLDEIHKGDIVICKAGQKAAVDGTIIAGKAYFDEAFITGESKPVLKQVDNMVIAGSINYDGYIEYRAERIGNESTVSEIVKLVVEASNTKAPITKVADKVSGYFVPIVILIAFITFFAYLLIFQDFGSAVSTFVTILVVACPCSLGLATPLAIVISEGMCASNGILIKKSEILENAQKVSTVVFDKTGTLTYGKLKISEIINYSTLDEKTLFQLVGSIESKSSHPIASAFTNYLKENKIEILKVDSFENLEGIGVISKIGNDEILLGNAKLFEKYEIENKYLSDAQKLSDKGNSIVYVIKNKEVLAIVGVNDIVRNEALQLIDKLKSKGIDVMMLTGDNHETAKKIANEIGISHVISNVLPAQKTATIKQLKKENKFVMMCGDGINDSPALATADIGVSITSSTDIAADSSDVILTKNNLNSIIDLIHISKKTIRNIKQNLFWAFFYNCLMIPIAMGVLKPFGITINPMIASLAMVLSSVTVILNALRLRRIK